MSLQRRCNVTIHAQTALRQNYQILTHYTKINLCESQIIIIKVYILGR